MQYTIQKFANGMHYILLENKIVKKLTTHQNKRVVCNINNTVQFHAAIMKEKEGGYYIFIGKTHLKKIKATVGMPINAVFEIDKSPLQFNMPEEFMEVLATDDKAKKIFDGLTDGNKRGLIYLIDLLKTSDKKIQRSLLIAEKIKAGVTNSRLVLKK
jgi:hypothetical protein